MKYSLTVKLLLLAALIVVGGASFAYWRWYEEPLPLDHPIDVEIEPGAGLRGIAEQFQRQGVLRSTTDLILLARLRRATSLLHAGEYHIVPGMTVASLLSLLESNQVVMHSLTLVEGWTFQQVYMAVEQNPDLQHDFAGLRPSEIMTRLGHPDESSEGRFLPDTYRFPRHTKDSAFLARAYTAMREKLDAVWQGRDPGLPYRSAYDALIMASMVEKETGQPSERAEIAGVFVRRLQKGMKLQSDPTVIYGMGERYQGNITLKDLRLDTPYNTYTRYGLPPAPICMPGAAALLAAVHPANGTALYFVARGDGTHQFSDTLAEQNAAVRKYQLDHGKP